MIHSVFSILLSQMSYGNSSVSELQKINQDDDNENKIKIWRIADDGKVASLIAGVMKQVDKSLENDKSGGTLCCLNAVKVIKDRE